MNFDDIIWNVLTDYLDVRFLFHTTLIVTYIIIMHILKMGYKMTLLSGLIVTYKHT